MLNITIKHERHTDVRWFSNLIDAFARADGPPPQRWAEDATRAFDWH